MKGSFLKENERIEALNDTKYMSGSHSNKAQVQHFRAKKCNFEVWKYDSGKSKSTNELWCSGHDRESPDFNRSTFPESRESSGCRFWVRRPQKHPSIHVTTCPFPSLLKPTFMHKDKDTDAETLPGLGCTVWSELSEARGGDVCTRVSDLTHALHDRSVCVFSCITQTVFVSWA